LGWFSAGVELTQEVYELSADPNQPNSTAGGPRRDPRLGDSIVAAGSFSLTVGHGDLSSGIYQQTELGEQDDPDQGGAQPEVSQTDIDAAVKATKDPEFTTKKLLTPRKVDLIMKTLESQVSTLCERAENAPVRTDDLNGLKDTAFVDKQRINVDRIAKAKDLSNDGKEELQANLNQKYEAVKAEFEQAKAEQRDLEFRCRDSKEKMMQMTAAAEQMKQTAMTQLKLPQSAFNVTREELGRVRVCQRIIGARPFQQWLASQFKMDLKMQRKEVQCWSNKVEIARANEQAWENILSSAQSQNKLLKQAMKCIVNPLVERVFASVGDVPADGDKRDDVQAFVMSIEQNNRTADSDTVNPEVPDDPASPQLIDDMLLGESSSGNSTALPKALFGNDTTKDARRPKPPAVKYECLYEKYIQESGAFATGKMAIEENAPKEFARIERMIQPPADEPPPSVDLGESSSSGCLGFLKLFFNSTTSKNNVLEEVRKQLHPPVSTDAMADPTVDARKKLSKTLKSRVTDFVENMKQVIATETSNHINGARKSRDAASATKKEFIAKMTQAKGALQGIKDKRGSEEKLKNGACVDSACYIATEVKTEVMAPFMSQEEEPEEYEQMKWTCRRNPSEEEHTRNAFMCTSFGKDAKAGENGSVTCKGKEVKIGTEWVPFLRDIKCSKDNSCEEVKQCSSNTINIGTSEAQSLLQLSCMTF